MHLIMSITKTIRRMSTRNIKQQVSCTKNAEFFSSNFSHNKKKPAGVTKPPHAYKMESFEIIMSSF